MFLLKTEIVGTHSNEYPQSMFLSRNKKNNVYPCKPQFYYIKVAFKGPKLYRHGIVMYGCAYSWTFSLLFYSEQTSYNFREYFFFKLTKIMNGYMR